MYLIEKTINKLFKTGYTFFLNPRDTKEIVNHLNKNTYSIYKPYAFAEKSIIYIVKPEIILFEIKTNATISHKDILGSLFSLKIDEGLFGDIIITNNKYYFYTFKKMKSFFEMEFTKIGKNNIKLEEKDVNFLNDFKPIFESIEIVSSSLRIDSVVAKVIHTNRDNIKSLIKDKQITYNYDILDDGRKNLKIGDTFSVRKHGKYIFNDIVKNTKKNNLIINILKYSDKN